VLATEVKELGTEFWFYSSVLLCVNVAGCYKAAWLPDVEGGDHREPVRSDSEARHPVTAGTAADKRYAAGSPKNYLLFQFDITLS
jgi:hypothetical protein